MKYEEIKIWDVFTCHGDKETVISKSDEYNIITTIDDNMIPTTWEKEELHYLKPLKEELPEEGLLVCEGIIIYRTGRISGYGFNAFKNYESLNDAEVGWTFDSSPEEWRKATKQEEEEFVEMLKKECEKRGLFEDTKIENHADGTAIICCEFTPTGDATEFWNKNGLIFYKGKFAKPIKEEPTLELVSKAVQEIGDFTVEQTESGLIILTPINHE